MTDDFPAPRWQPNTYSLWPTILVRRTFAGCEEPNRALIALVEKMDREGDQLTATHWHDVELLEVDDDGIRWLRKGIDETIRAYFDRAGMNYGIGWKIAAWPNINRLGDYHAPHNHAWTYLSGTYYVKVPEPSGEAAPDGLVDGIRWLRKGIDETIRAYFDRAGMNYGIGWKIAAWPNINRLGDYHAPHNHAWTYLSGTYYVKVPEPSGEAAPDGLASPAGISFYDPRTAVNMLARDGEALSRREFAVRPSAGLILMWHSSINHSVHPNLSEDTRISISFNISLAWSDHYLNEE